MKTIFGLAVFVFITLLFRLVDIQLLSGRNFEKIAINNKTYSVVFPEERGVFLDRYSRPLVYNKPVYYKLNSDKSLYADEVRVAHEEALIAMSKNSDSVRTELERMYLYPKSLAHVLGYVGKVSSDELLADSSLHINDKVGKFGLEKEFQNFLRGSSKLKIFEVNALGEKQHLIAEEAGFPGKNIPTTLDPDLSEVALMAMGDNKGSVIIIDASNSEILSMVSTPSFDSSVLSESFDDEYLERKRMLNIKDSFSNPQKLFFNRAISGAYPPGSVFKLITAFAGLEGKKIDENTSVLDDGILKVGDYSYANWYFTQFGRKEGEISLIRAIARSNDIYFYKVAEWVGPEKLKEMASLFSFGEKTGVQLQAEIAGLIPDPDWKQRVIGERWYLGNTYHMGIGQGNILVSPIQISQLVQAIANNGNICKPTLVKDSFNSGGTFAKNRCHEVGVLEDNINLVLEGMLEACSAGGTGFPFFNYNSTVLKEDLGVKDQLNNGAVACKTGTSEFGGVDENGFRKTHAWFVSIINTRNLIKNILETEDKIEIKVDDVNKVENSDNNIDSNIDRNSWVDGVREHGFPEEIIITVLIESDEANHYKEGSRDGGPVAKAIFDWIKDGKLPASSLHIAKE